MFHPKNKLIVAALAAALAASAAQAQAPAAPPGNAGAAPAGAPPAAAAAAPKPFKDVVKDAKEIAGYFTLYQKDDKTWMAIKPEQFDKPFFFSVNIPQSVGERGLYGSQMGDAHMVVFKRLGNQVQLVAVNAEFFAKPGTPQAQFVSEAFSDSLLASGAVASAAHPDNKAVLVDLGAMLNNDIAGYSTNLDYAYRMGFALDKANSGIVKVHNSDKLTGVMTKNHFSVAKINPPPLTPPPVPMPPPPRSVPDPRSLFVSFYYSFTPLPETPMAPRVADERVGHFVTARTDFTEDLSVKAKAHYVNRWRLEKKDPSAAVSEPKEPIVYWLDKNIPEKYRKSVAEGVLEWNKAFEKSGFKNALVVKQQTDKDDFDTMDARHASIRWFVGADVGFAIGPSHVDPRSGEILDADIGMSDVFARGARRQVIEDFSRPAGHEHAHSHAPASHKKQSSCNYMNESAHELHFALDLLEARGLDMDSPEAEAVAQSYVKDVIMHEVGHTLGFRHNFKASTVYSAKQIQDVEFTKKNGITTSVMDYTPFNIAAKGEKQPEYGMSTLGAYDYWAVDYAYRQIDAAKEKEELAKIAARSTEPQLIYATDEDAGYGTMFYGIDPEANRFDLGADPLEYYKKRLKLSRELWDRLESLQLKPGESYERLTRSFVAGLNQVARVAPLAAKYVGGVKHLRDRAGSGRALYEPTSPARQREALKLVADGLLKVDSFKFKPEFVSRIGIDHFERRANPDVSISAAVLGTQRQALDVLMADSVAQRLLDSADKVADPSKAFKLAELYDTVQNAIWSELKAGGDINPLRRNLQREHLRRVVNALVKPAPTTPADARALQRMNAQQLAAQIKAALGKAGNKETKAHLAESLDLLSEALKASIQRTV